MSATLQSLGIVLTFIIPLAISVVAAWHALLFKRDPRAALGWMAVCLALPLAGPLLYFIFGVNRVRSKARQLRGEPRRRFVDFERGVRPESPSDDIARTDRDILRNNLPVAACALEISRAAGAVTGRPLAANNRVAILRNGEEAFPAMLEAIAEARHSIFLTTYIFENNKTGVSFVDALEHAVDRGVEVRVIVDGMGAWYSWGLVRLLHKREIPVQAFNPPRIWPLAMGFNLRNHRKILVLDHCVAFAGGMNIGDRHLIDLHSNKRPTADTMFRLEGPVAVQLADIFADTWGVCSSEPLPLASSISDKGCLDKEQHTAVCRAIADGPDDNLDKLALIFVAAIDSARHSIRIMTPYFLPDPGMTAVLQTAALRGLQVSIVLPEKNNLPYVHWATRSMLWELLSCDVKVYYQPGIFNHTKVLLIDNCYAVVGSANIDPRSLRLNYELGVEIYDENLVARLIEDFDRTVEGSRPLSRLELEKRSLFERTRDAVCWLASPYL